MTTNPGRTSAVDSRPTVSSGELKVLLALLSSDTLETEALRSKLSLDESEYNSILGSLQKQYMVDAISQLKGDEVREGLRLTEHGESVLTDIMERTCELPE